MGKPDTQAQHHTRHLPQACESDLLLGLLSLGHLSGSAGYTPHCAGPLPAVPTPSGCLLLFLQLQANSALPLMAPGPLFDIYPVCL